jgi:hypothetical protein
MSGDILIHEENKPLTQLANSSHDITALQNFAMAWNNLGKEITSTPDAIRGNTMPSGTAFRQVAILNKESSSLFEVMVRTKKRYMEKILREFVVPHLKKKIDTNEEIVAILDSQGVSQIDQMYVPKEAVKRNNEYLKNEILSGKIAFNPDLQSLQKQIQEEQNMLGNQRFIKPSDIESKTWKDILKDFEWEMDIEITDRDVDKQTMATNLIDLFKTLVNPNVQQFIQTPQGKMLYHKILESSSTINPIQLPQTVATPPQPETNQLTQ